MKTGRTDDPLDVVARLESRMLGAQNNCDTYTHDSSSSRIAHQRPEDPTEQLTIRQDNQQFNRAISDRSFIEQVKKTTHGSPRGNAGKYDGISTGRMRWRMYGSTERSSVLMSTPPPRGAASMSMDCEVS